MKVEYIKSKKGLITIEILIALFLITIAVSSAVFLSFGSQTNVLDTQLDLGALLVAQSFLDRAKIEGKANFNSLTSKNLPQVNIYKNNQLEVSNWDGVGLIKKVSSNVNGWNFDGRNRYSKLTTLLSNYKRILQGNDECSQDLIGDWKNIQHYEFQSADIIPNSNANGIEISDLKFFDQKLYVAAKEPTVNDPSTFYIFNLPQNLIYPPEFLGRVDNSSTVTTGLNSLTIVPYENENKIYVFVANAYAGANANCSENHNCAQVQVIDATNPTNPTMTKNIKIEAKNTSGKLPAGNVVYYYRGFVYVGLAKVASNSSRGEFNIIDIGGGGGIASPTNPILRGTYRIGAGINDIIVRGKYAYLAHPEGDTPETETQLTVLNIEDPDNPQKVSYFYHNGASGGNGKSLYIKDNDLYLGRTATKLSGQNDAIPEFFILDISDPTIKPLESKGSLPLPTSGDSINGLAVKNNLAFFLTNKEFQVWNISDPSSIQFYSSISLSEFSQGSPTGGGAFLNCSGDYFYLAISSPQGNQKDIIAIVGSQTENSYSLSNSGDISLSQGQSGTVTISANLIANFFGNIAFSLEGLPSGANFAFNPASCVPNCQTQLTITTSFPHTPAGTYPITVKGTGGVTTTFNLIVTPQNFDFNIANSGNINLIKGFSGSNTITLTLLSGLTQQIYLSVNGLPAGAGHSFSNNGCSPTCSTNLTININSSSNTPTGTYPITVNAGTKETSFNLIVNDPFVYALSTNGNITINRGSSGTVTVNLSLVSGSPRAVTLSVSGLNSQAFHINQTQINPNSCTPNCSSTITLRTKNNAPSGTYTITVNGTSDDLSPRSVSFQVTIP